MKTFVGIDDDRFNELCLQVGLIEDHLAASEIWECISMLGIKPFKDGNQWCFLYGENIQEGIVGFGDSIFDAALEFYREIYCHQ